MNSVEPVLVWLFFLFGFVLPPFVWDETKRIETKNTEKLFTFNLYWLFMSRMRLIEVICAENELYRGQLPGGELWPIFPHFDA